MNGQCDADDCDAEADIDMSIKFTYTDGTPDSTEDREYCQEHAMKILEITTGIKA